MPGLESRGYRHCAPRNFICVHPCLSAVLPRYSSSSAAPFCRTRPRSFPSMNFPMSPPITPATAPVRPNAAKKTSWKVKTVIVRRFIAAFGRSAERAACPPPAPPQTTRGDESPHSKAPAPQFTHVLTSPVISERWNEVHGTHGTHGMHGKQHGCTHCFAPPIGDPAIFPTLFFRVLTCIPCTLHHRIEDSRFCRNRTWSRGAPAPCLSLGAKAPLLLAELGTRNAE